MILRSTNDKSLKIFKLSVSLGALACVIRAGAPKETRESIGITDNLIRKSVGIEDINDLINDLINHLINDISQAFDELI